MSMESFAQFKKRNANLLKGKTNAQKRELYNKTVARNGLKSPQPSSAQPKQKRVRKARVKSEMGYVNIPHLSHCSRLYLKALTNPFGGFSESPCIPDEIAIPSWKISATVRANFIIGTQGVGFCCVDPYNLANDLPSAWQTTAAYALANIDANSAVGITPILNNGPITNAGIQNGQGMQVRTVGCGVRAMYTGSEITRQGQMVLYRKADGPGLVVTNWSNFANERQSTIVPVERKKHTVSYRPDDFANLGYSPPRTVLSTAMQQSQLLIAVEGATPGQSFSYEVMWHYEVIGGRLVYPTTSHSDPTGMGAVISALPLPNSPTDAKKTEETTLERVMDTLSKSLTGIISVAPSVAKTVLPMAMKYAMGPAAAPIANLIEGVQSVKIEDVDD